MRRKLLQPIDLSDNTDDLASKIAAHRVLITTETLAAYLDVSKKSIYAWVKSGTLPAMRFGASIRFDPAKTAAWVRARSA